MAKKKNKKGGFVPMDFLIVTGIAAVAYFLFSSFSRGPIKPPALQEPVNPVNPQLGPIQTQSSASGSIIGFTKKEREQTLLNGNSNNPLNSVKALQLFLTKAGHNTQGIDGVFGNNTETALDAYLGSSGLLPTPVTLEELGIYAVNFGTNQVFGYDMRTGSALFRYSVPKEYLNKTQGWVYNDAAIAAYAYFKEN